MDIRTKIGSQRYTKEADLQGRATVITIKQVAVENVGQGRDAEEKVVLYFAETDKGLVLNSTNANSIIEMYGYETGEWLDGKIEVYPTTTDFAGKTVGCIRVRKPTAPPPAVTPVTPAPSDCPF